MIPPLPSLPWYATTADNPRWRRIANVRLSPSGNVQVIFTDSAYDVWQDATGISCIRGDE